MKIDDTIRAFEDAANQNRVDGYVHVKTSKKNGITYIFSKETTKGIGKKLHTNDLIEHAKKLLLEAEIKNDPDKEKRLHAVIEKIATRGEKKINDTKNLKWIGNIFKKIWSSARNIQGNRQKFLEQVKVSAAKSVLNIETNELLKEIETISKSTTNLETNDKEKSETTKKDISASLNTFISEKIPTLNDQDNSYKETFQKSVDIVVSRLKSESYEDLKTLRQIKSDLIQKSKQYSALNGLDQKILFFDSAIVIINSKIAKLEKTNEIKKKIALEKIGAFRSGIKSRERNITVPQMTAILQPHLLGAPSQQIKEVARALCREINEMAENPEPYKGKSLQLTKDGLKKYTFFSGDKSNPELVTLNVDCWLEMSKDGKNITLTITPPNQNILGIGGYKKVSKAQGFVIPFKVEKEINHEGTPKTKTVLYQRKGQYSPKALLEPIDLTSAKSVDLGIIQQKKLQDRGVKGTVSLPTKPNPLVEGTKANSDKPQYFQEWYNSDLENAALDKEIPLDFSENPKALAISTPQILNVLIEVGNAFMEWHSLGIIHCDVKPANILLKVDQDGTTVHGLPADYDFAQEVGLGLIQDARYQYWDALANRGLGTPFTDVFGLAITLGKTLVPKFNSIQPSSLNDPKTRSAFIDSHIQTLKQNKTPDEIALIKGVLELIGEIVVINENLGRTVPIENDDTLSTVENFEDYRSNATKNSNNVFRNLFREIEQNFGQSESYFSRNIFSNVPNNLTIHEKIIFMKNEIIKSLGDENLSEQEKTKLREIYDKIDRRESAVLYMLVTPKEAIEHPLYNALRSPKSVDSPETAKLIVDEEISLFLNSFKTKFPEFEGVLKTDNLAKEELRSVIKERIKHQLSQEENSHLTEKLKEILQHMELVEKSMDFILERRAYYKQQASIAMSKAMSMEDFVSRLKTLKQNFEG